MTLDPSPPANPAPSSLTWVAGLFSLLALGGSLYLSVGLTLKACPLCLYQRTFVMGAVGVLVIGLLIRRTPSGVVSVLALPMAAAGTFIAGLHVSLEARGILECPAGLGGFGTAPQQALAIQALLTLTLIFDALKNRLGTGVLGSLILAGALAYGAFISSPPPPPGDYTKPVDQDGCRKMLKTPAPV